MIRHDRRSRTQDVTLWPRDLRGAVLDIYGPHGKPVGEHLAKWLEYAGFSGPVLMYSGRNLPPALPTLARVFTAKKPPEDDTDLANLLKVQLNDLCGMLCDATLDPRVNSRGIGPGGADDLATLRSRQAEWDCVGGIPHATKLPLLQSIGVVKQQTRLGNNPVIAFGKTVAELSALRKSTASAKPFYLMLFRETDGIDPFEALRNGVVYLDAARIEKTPLRFATETAEELSVRYSTLVRQYSTKNLDAIPHAGRNLLAAFMIAYFRAIAFSGGSHQLYKTREHMGWVVRLTGLELPQTFEDSKKALLKSAKTLGIVPDDIELW